MIVYQSTKHGFYNDFLTGEIEVIILKNYGKVIGGRVSPSEITSWRNSLHYMNTVLSDSDIPNDIGIGIEIQIPQTSKRIDFIITGESSDQKDQAMIIELKQWSSAELTEEDGIVLTPLGKGLHKTTHPSYQAWSYAALLYGFNEAVYSGNISVTSCAYLHNYLPDNVIKNPFYQSHIEKAPVFLKNEIRDLQSFIKKYVKYGDRKKVLYRLVNGKIRPSKQLAESISSMLIGNEEFVMVDDQKIVFESILAIGKRIKKSKSHNKNVIIVKGGPGTGKSVVAVNLLVEFTRQRLLVQYVSKNAAPRSVYSSKLTGTLRQSEIKSLFKGSGAHITTKENQFDVLVVDEAHRLNEKSGLYANLGENQVKELIHGAQTTAFFIDEDQRVTFDDIGTIDEIKKWAKRLNTEVTELELSSQFRCNGSDGYLAWLDNTLQIRETANKTLEGIDYDFRVFDNPNELRKAIIEKNKVNNRSRMVAGYCWDWVSKSKPKLKDVVIPEFDFEMTWNLTKDGSLWIISPDSVNEIGCIHTCQGLEVDYIGVIIGPDLAYRDGQILVNPAARAKTDRSIRGWKRMMEKEPEKTKEKIRMIIKNTYRTLMTRGMKGCYVYCCDENLKQYFKGII